MEQHEFVCSLCAVSVQIVCSLCARKCSKVNVRPTLQSQSTGARPNPKLIEFAIWPHFSRSVTQAPLECPKYSYRLSLKLHFKLQWPSLAALVNTGQAKLVTKLAPLRRAAKGNCSSRADNKHRGPPMLIAADRHSSSGAPLVRPSRRDTVRVESKERERQKSIIVSFSAHFLAQKSWANFHKLCPKISPNQRVCAAHLLSGLLLSLCPGQSRPFVPLWRPPKRLAGGNKWRQWGPSITARPCYFANGRSFVRVRASVSAMGNGRQPSR